MAITSNIKRLLISLLLLVSTVESTNIEFSPSSITLHMHDTVAIQYNLTIDSTSTERFVIVSETTHVANVQENLEIHSGNNVGYFNLTGVFLGQTSVVCKNVDTDEILEETLEVIVIREERIVDRIFTASTATLVALIYVNFGCAVNWSELRNILRKPIGPAIGFTGQFVIMPVLSYTIGLILFPDNPEMRLGMFFTGVSPGGGASNIWTAVLDGNIDLSVIMSTVSTIAAFGMMPLWIFTLGKVIFDEGNLEVPYTQITTYVLALVVPLGIGYLITRYLQKFGQFMKRILKGFSSLLILFIIIFAIVTNLYLFELMSWRIVLAGMGLPYLGYSLGYLLALACRQPPKNCLAIAVETGIANTGISIFLLRFALPQPQADLTTVAPVAVAIMTPFPLMIWFIILKLKQCIHSRRKLNEVKEQNSIENAETIKS